MGNRLILILIAFGIVFFAGWIFANEVTPPRVEDISAAAWIVAVLVAVVMAGMATGGATR